MRKAIVAIGGGDIRTRGTFAIDREIIRLSKKKHPRLLFIPTASHDSERYWKHVREYFGRFLKCKTDALFLTRDRPPREAIRSKILSADIIYVGGGNTLHMMRVWRFSKSIDCSNPLTKKGPSSAASVPVRSAGLSPGIPIHWLFIVPVGGNTSM